MTRGAETGRHRRRALHRERGSVSLELAIVFPVLLLLFFAGMQAALYFYGRSVALAAAEEGARVAAAESGTAAAGRTAAASFADRAAGSFLQDRTVAGSRAAARATFTVSGRSLSVLPGTTGFRISQTASLPVERVT